MWAILHVLLIALASQLVSGQLDDYDPYGQNHNFGQINSIHSDVLGESNFLNSLINAIIFRAHNEDGPIETTVTLAKAAGYEAEAHQVETIDNYLLTIHRIYKRNVDVKTNKNDIFSDTEDIGDESLATDTGVIFLQHGLMGSSDNWVTNVREECLAYQLADKGYDVWMGNFRGSIYSRGHTHMNDSDPEYWKFCVDEMAEYDLPAMISYVLDVTQSSSIHYIGHSMGTTAFFASASSSNFLETRIKSMIALAPAAVMSSRNVLTPIKYLAPLAKQLQLILQLTGNGDELLTNRLLLSLWEPYRACKFRFLCENLQFMITGFDPFRAHKETLPLILSHNPAGSSTQTLVHFAQGITSGKFSKFDYGGMYNIYRYGRMAPPEYDLTQVNIPVTLFWAANDWFIGEEDVVVLEESLPNLRASHKVENPEFSHLDFLWATDANALVYDKIVRYYETNEVDDIQEKNEIAYVYSAAKYMDRRKPREYTIFQNIYKMLLN